MNNLEVFKKYYEKEYKEISNKLINFNKELINEDNKLMKENLSFFKDLNGNGKLIRGILVSIGYYLLKDNKSYSHDLALAYEVFQTSILVHDDIIDKDNKRRGTDTIHFKNYKKYEKYGSDEEIKHLSNSIGLCIGDYGLHKANEIIIDAYKDDKNVIKVFSYYNKIVLNTIKGETLDVILPINSKNDLIKNKDLENIIMDIYRLKTAYYTIIGPLNSGLILAGGDNKKEKDIEKFGLKIGIAFQIQDDILGIFSNKMERDLCSDIKEGKQTILYSYILNTKYREEFEKYYGKENITKETIDKVKELLTISKAYEYAINMMNNYYDEGIKIINSIDWISEDKKNLLIGFVESLRKRNK